MSFILSLFRFIAPLYSICYITSPLPSSSSHHITSHHITSPSPPHCPHAVHGGVPTRGCGGDGEVRPLRGGETRRQHHVGGGEKEKRRERERERERKKREGKAKERKRREKKREIVCVCEKEERKREETRREEKRREMMMMDDEREKKKGEIMKNN